MGSHINDSTAANDTQRVMDSIRRIVQALRTAAQQSQQRYGLSAAQFFVLQKLAEGKAASLNELAARTRTHQSSVSVVVQRLVSRKLVTRHPAPQDSRRLVLSLTPAGRKLIHRSPQAAQDRLIAAIDQLPHARQRSLAQLLESVADHAIDQKLPPSLFFEKAGPQRKTNGSW